MKVKFNVTEYEISSMDSYATLNTDKVPVLYYTIHYTDPYINILPIYKDILASKEKSFTIILDNGTEKVCNYTDHTNTMNGCYADDTKDIATSVFEYKE